MTTVIGVRFKKAGKVYYFDPTDVWPQPGDQVVVETSRGIELGEVIAGAREVEDEQIVAPLKKVIRVATPEDIRREEYNRSREPETFRICQERIAQHKLEMKLVDAEYTFDGAKIIFYFTANGRIDFRELVKDLASIFKMRIELRQIGVRDEAKMLGGLGPCGRQLCCDAFLGDFQPVSIKMAKEQNLSLNPTKISGQCGRLMCCLKYEQDYYEAALKKLPKVGKECITPDGPGYITDINVIREKVKVRIRAEGDTFDLREYPLNEITKPNRAEGEAPSPRPADMKPRKRPKPPKPEDKPKETPPEEEDNKRRRPPRPKGPKQLNADQYFDKLNAERADAKDAEAKKKGEGRSRRERRKAQDRPEGERPEEGGKAQDRPEGERPEEGGKAQNRPEGERPEEGGKVQDQPQADQPNGEEKAQAQPSEE